MRKPRQLNRNRPFGKITGRFEKHPSARFEQDGFYFTANGVECDSSAAAQPSAGGLTAEQEAHLAEVAEWVKSQTGQDGRLELEKYAENLEIEGAGDMKVSDLRSAIVESFEAQLLAAE